MIQIIADNIISGLGKSTEENLEALRQGRSALKETTAFKTAENNRVIVSAMDDSILDESIRNSGMTRLEKFMVSSVKTACAGLDSGILERASTVFIFSSTKGNIRYLLKDSNRAALWNSAETVSGYFGNPNKPITVSNACISGVAAMIAGKRLLEAGLYDTAVVVGADELTDFVVSGFGSFKALSDEPCRPFDASRKGLNLGEAVGTIVLRKAESAEDVFLGGGYLSAPQFIAGGAITNDANHISGPSRTAEGLYRAIIRTLGVTYGSSAEITDGEAFINPHGTATLYNDQMESLAVFRSGLGNLEVSPLKGYYGHTLGASGVIETILSCRFLDEGWLPAAKGYEASGCDPSPKISSSERETKAKWFLKTVSGFGGCNAAIKVEKLEYKEVQRRLSEPKSVSIPAETKSEGSFSLEYKGNVREYLSSLYRESGLDYPKFHKMDLLCKAGIIVADRLLKVSGKPDKSSLYEDDTTALVFMNSSSSYAADTEYLKTIAGDNFFPSPSVFVYTLPSIVIGEISIRHKFYGEGAFFVNKDFDRQMAMDYISRLIDEKAADKAILCWIECLPEYLSVKAELIGRI